MDNKWNYFVSEHLHKIQNIDSKYNTVVINAYAGPGAGKTTACLEIAEKLKKENRVVEYVQEYAKDLVWEEDFELLDGSEAHQFEILKEQLNRIDRLYGKAEFIITDSPILLNKIYNQELTEEYSDMLGELYSHFNNFNFVVQRDASKYEQDGRIQTLEESIVKDKEVTDLLEDFQLYYGKYNHKTIDKVVNNAMKTYDRLQKCNKFKKEVNSESMKQDVSHGEYTISLNAEEMAAIKNALEQTLDHPLYKWESDVYKNVSNKIDIIYQKPIMSQDEFNKIVDEHGKKITNWFRDDTGYIYNNAMQSKRQNLRFYNNVVETSCENEVFLLDDKTNDAIDAAVENQLNDMMEYGVEMDM